MITISIFQPIFLPYVHLTTFSDFGPYQIMLKTTL